MGSEDVREWSEDEEEKRLEKSGPLGRGDRPRRTPRTGTEGKAGDAHDGSAWEDWAVSSAAVERPTQPRGDGGDRPVKLQPGERLGWWSAKKFDRRVRMRAMVMGAVNDKRTKILLDTGANVSALSESWARKLRLKRVTNQDRRLDVQGIGATKVQTSSRATVKITLGWKVVYEFVVWIMPHHAGVDLILGTDFMIPAGIRLDLYNSTAKLPDEVVVPLLRSQRSGDNCADHESWSADGPPEALVIPSRHTAEFQLRCCQPGVDRAELWVRRSTQWIPTVKYSSRGKAVRVLLTNVSEKTAWCAGHFPVAVWSPHGVLPPDNGYVRLNSAKYRDWQVLAYESARDKGLFEKERILYDAWVAEQPPNVERILYDVPNGIQPRPRRNSTDDSDELSCSQRWERLHRTQSRQGEVIQGNDEQQSEQTPSMGERSSLPAELEYQTSTELQEVVAAESISLPSQLDSAEHSDASHSENGKVEIELEETDCGIAETKNQASAESHSVAPAELMAMLPIVDSAEGVSPSNSAENSVSEVVRCGEGVPPEPDECEDRACTRLTVTLPLWQAGL